MPIDLRKGLVCSPGEEQVKNASLPECVKLKASLESANRNDAGEVWRADGTG
jgi:hypothetical protein